MPDRVRRYPLDTLVVGMRLTYSVAANWKVIAENYNECYHCGPVHPELSRLVPAFGGGAADLAWDDGIPHREGAWTFTLSGTTDRAPFPDLDDAERVRHKGELVYPNLLLSLSAEHVAAFVLRPNAVDRTEITCDLLFAPDEAAKPGFDPSDAGDLWDLVNRQDWAICESVQRGMTSRYYTQGWFAPMEDASLDIRRWLLPRLERTASVAETCDLAVIGLGALGSSTAWHAASRGLRVVGIEAFEFGHDRGASHDTSRIIRHSYHTPAYVALTFGAYDEWARLEDETGEQFVTVTGGLDLFPPDAQIPMDDYTSSMDAHDIAYDVLDVGAVGERWPAFVLPDGTTAIHQARTGIVPAAAGTAAMARRARELGAALHYNTRVEAIVPGADGVELVTDRRRGQRGTGGCHRRRVDRRPARPARRRPAADGHRGAGHLLRSRPARGVRSRRVPGVDLDGRAVLLRVPHLRRGDRQGRAGLRRAHRDGR